ncbi:MAG: hypothetical protein ACI3T9_01135 [Romboutsia timonensis]
MKTCNLKDIAMKCGVGEGAILNFIKYCIETGKEIPGPIPYQRSYYTYDEESANKIAEMFKNKKRGEMAEYNYKHNWGKKYRSKYTRSDIKQDDM